MNQTRIDYLKAKIYKIVSNKNGKVYYGSTTTSLMNRLAQHRHDYNMWKINEKKPRTCSSFDVLEDENAEIVLVENYPCNSKEMLNLREKYFIENNDCVNKNTPIVKQEKKPNNRFEKVKCECGDYISKTNISTHRKTHGHKAKMIPLDWDDDSSTEELACIF